jgi:hypothetical protein
VLADLAVNDPAAFAVVAGQARAALDAQTAERRREQQSEQQPA